MKNQSESKAVTKENLLNAFWSLYRRKQIEKITIKEITELAGYNRGTFYDYFIDIYDALEQLEESLLEYTQTAMGQFRESGPNQELLKYVADIFNSKSEYFSLFLGENRDPNFSNKMKSVIRPVFYELWGLSGYEKNASYIFEFVISAVIGALSHWYKSGKDIPYDEFIPLTQSMMINGAVAELQKISSRSDIIEFLKKYYNI